MEVCVADFPGGAVPLMLPPNLAQSARILAAVERAKEDLALHPADLSDEAFSSFMAWKCHADEAHRATPMVTGGCYEPAEMQLSMANLEQYAAMGRHLAAMDLLNA